MKAHFIFPKESRMSATFAQLSGWLASVKPTYWLLLVLLVSGLCAAFVPHTIWKTLLRAAESNKALVGILLLFALLSISLVWTAGQRVDAAFFFLFQPAGIAAALDRYGDAFVYTTGKRGDGICHCTRTVYYGKPFACLPAGFRDAVRFGLLLR